MKSSEKNLTAQAGYGLAFLMMFVASTVLIGTSLQLVLGATASNYLGVFVQDKNAAQQLASSAIDSYIIPDIQSDLNQNTAVTTSYTFPNTAVPMPTDPANLAGSTVTAGNISATMTAARGDNYLVKVTATVGTATAISSRLLTMTRTNGLSADSMTAPVAAYGLRKLRSAYAGSAIRVRRSSDDTEQDIGFDSNGNLDLNSLKTFIGASSPPADVVTSPKVAFGLRRLSSSYTGYCLKVRRSSDSTTRDIGFTADGELDVEALLDFVGTGSGYVDTWYDQSGNATNATQSTAANQPTIVLNGVLKMVNNRPAIYYDGSNDNMQLTRTISDDFTIMICYNVIAGRGAFADNDWWSHASLLDADMPGGANDFGMAIDTSGYLYGGIGLSGNNNASDFTVQSHDNTADRVSPSGYNDGRIHWVAMDRTKANGLHTLYQDQWMYVGPDYNNNKGNLNSLTASANIGIAGVTGATNYVSGYVNEILIYNSVLTTVNRNKLKSNEFWYYNIYQATQNCIMPFNLSTVTFPANTIGYSLRKLKSTATNAIKVRRSSDNTTQDIGFDNWGNLDVAALLTFVGAGSGYIDTWYDQSGSGKNLTQATLANQPLIVNSGALNMLNGKPSVKFSSTTSMGNTSLTANTGTQVSGYAYASNTAANSGGRIVSLYKTANNDDNNASSVALLVMDASNHLQTKQNNLISTTYGTYDYGSGISASCVYDSGKVPLFLNGGLGNATGTSMGMVDSTTFNYSNIMVGNSPANNHFIGNISEVIVTPADLAGRITLNSNILWYYNQLYAPAYVTKWYDQSGSSYDLAQTSPMLQPTVVLTPYGYNNGLPTVMFNGEQYLSRTTGMPTSADYSLAAVFSYFDSTQGNHIISTTSGTGHSLYMASGNYLKLYHNGAFVTSANAYAANRLYAAASTYTQTTPAKTGIVYNYNTQGATATTANSNTDPSITLGYYSGGADNLYGSVSEAMIFNRSLSTVDRTAIYNDERAYFGAQ
jgi:hypothetical protein